MVMHKRVALVTGANGISGNALIEHLIRQPRSEWDRIIITSRTPPKAYWQDARVEFIPLDFMQPVEKLIPIMQEECQNVTHAFFTSYVHADDFTQLRDTNVPLFRNFLDSLDSVAGDSLQRVCLQTGGKYYGFHLGPTIESPMTEQCPRVDDPEGHIFYYQQEDYLKELSSKRGWGWNVIRPGGIVGFTPGKTGMSEAITLALYFLVCKEQGGKASFPGNKFFFTCPDDKSYAPSIADQSVWAVTNDHTRNEAFNHSNGDVITWKTLLSKLGDYYGVEMDTEDTLKDTNQVGIEHAKGIITSQSWKIEDWAKDKKPIWEALCKKHGGNPEAFDWGTWWFLDWAVGKPHPTVMSSNKARKMGWARFDDTYDTYFESIKALEHAGVIPSRKQVLGNQPKL
ncbi:hypothetical protein BKA66DRAFT_489447 [Pyrenochaeta sp. MPI-SDFR-AT-0127]|nr:hypothetical protein BKA66DRAFT_489447 [Pyrenochaeta sp. MPI-SDFR-AT-0127]